MITDENKIILLDSNKSISRNRTKITKSFSNPINYKISQNNNNKWSEMLLLYFTTINSMDNNIEKVRSELYYLQNFSSSNLFNYLDKNSKKFLTLNDFKLFLQNNQISFSDKNLRKFIHNFDKDNDFSLNYNEFLGIISPKKEKMNRINKNDDERGNNIIISDETKKKFGELLFEELKFVEKCKEITQNIRNSSEFTTYEAFMEIVGNEKYINLHNLWNYLTKKGLNMSDVEINQLMFRIDSDNDGKISYEEFKDIFLSLNDIEFKFTDYNNNKNKTTTYIDYLKESQNVRLNDNDNKYKNHKYDLPLKIPKSPSPCDKDFVPISPRVRSRKVLATFALKPRMQMVLNAATPTNLASVPM